VPSPTDGPDRALVAAALALAGRGLGRVWPDPAEAVVFSAGRRVIGRAWRERAGIDDFVGRAAAGGGVRGATAALAVEPDAVTADALAAAGIGRALVPIERPGETAGIGIGRLRAAGIVVATGMQAAEARHLNAGAILRHGIGRPLVTFKTATSLDGRIATRTGRSQWITGPAARRRGHLLRANHDAIMVGIGTALADAPELTCRLPGLEVRSPVRIVVDGRLRLPPDARMVVTAGATPTWIVCRDDVDAARARALESAGVRLIRVAAGADGRPDPAATLAALGARGLTRLLVEGGGALAGSLMAARSIDRIAWFRAPAVIGGDGRPTVAPFGVDGLDEAAGFARVSLVPLDADVLEIYERVA